MDNLDLEQSFLEIEIMKAIAGHPNVVRVLDVFEDYESIYIVQE